MYRKREVGKSSDELASLEARLKEMEDRLKKSQQTQSRMSMSGINLGSTSNRSEAPNANQQLAAKDESDSKARSRPGTARATQQAPSSGNMPPTPGASEGEYYLVTKADLDDAPR